MLSAQEVLDTYFLESRCMLLELAATLDRYERAAQRDASGAGAEPDERLSKLQASLAILSDKEARVDRAECLLKLFSGPA